MKIIVFVLITMVICSYLNKKLIYSAVCLEWGVKVQNYFV